MGDRLRFDGAITGAGTASGTRLVVGTWAHSPFGPIVDVMIEDADGTRALLAPTVEVAEFVAATYHFDAVRIESTALEVDGMARTVASSSARATSTRW